MTFGLWFQVHDSCANRVMFLDAAYFQREGVKLIKIQPLSKTISVFYIINVRNSFPKPTTTVWIQADFLTQNKPCCDLNVMKLKLLHFAVFCALWSVLQQYQKGLFLSVDGLFGRNRSINRDARILNLTLNIYFASHPSLFGQRSQILALILKPVCCSISKFTGKALHNVFMHNASEGYYSNNNKTETDYSTRLCLRMGWEETTIVSLSAKYHRKLNSATYMSPTCW